MVQVLLRILKVMAVLAIICFGLWALNQFGVIDIKTVVLQTLSQVPGWNDLADNYELGNKRNSLWQERDQNLKARELKLIAAQQRLARDRDSFTNDRNQWNNSHPTTRTATPSQTGNTVVPGSITPPLTSDAKIKEYLTMLGSMKPKQAAVVIQKLPEETVFAIFDQLSQFQVIKIMENLPEDYLAKLTQDRLNRYRNL